MSADLNVIFFLSHSFTFFAGFIFFAFIKSIDFDMKGWIWNFWTNAKNHVQCHHLLGCNKNIQTYQFSIQLIKYYIYIYDFQKDILRTGASWMKFWKAFEMLHRNQWPFTNLLVSKLVSLHIRIPSTDW